MSKAQWLKQSHALDVNVFHKHITSKLGFIDPFYSQLLHWLGMCVAIFSSVVWEQIFPDSWYADLQGADVF